MHPHLNRSAKKKKKKPPRKNVHLKQYMQNPHLKWFQQPENSDDQDTELILNKIITIQDPKP